MTSDGTKIVLMQWAQQPLFYAWPYNSNLNKRFKRIRTLVFLISLWLPGSIFFFIVVHLRFPSGQCFVVAVFVTLSALHLGGHKAIWGKQTKGSYSFSILHMRKLFFLHFIVHKLDTAEAVSNPNIHFKFKLFYDQSIFFFGFPTLLPVVKIE